MVQTLVIGVGALGAQVLTSLVSRWERPELQVMGVGTVSVPPALNDQFITLSLEHVPNDFREENAPFSCDLHSRAMMRLLWTYELSSGNSSRIFRLWQRQLTHTLKQGGRVVACVVVDLADIFATSILVDVLHFTHLIAEEVGQLRLDLHLYTVLPPTTQDISEQSQAFASLQELRRMALFPESTYGFPLNYAPKAGVTWGKSWIDRTPYDLWYCLETRHKEVIADMLGVWVGEAAQETDLQNRANLPMRQHELNVPEPIIGSMASVAFFLPQHSLKAVWQAQLVREQTQAVLKQRLNPSHIVTLIEQFFGQDSAVSSVLYDLQTHHLTIASPERLQRLRRIVGFRPQWNLETIPSRASGEDGLRLVRGLKQLLETALSATTQTVILPAIALERQQHITAYVHEVDQSLHKLLLRLLPQIGLSAVCQLLAQFHTRLSALQRELKQISLPVDYSVNQLLREITERERTFSQEPRQNVKVSLEILWRDARETLENLEVLFLVQGAQFFVAQLIEQVATLQTTLTYQEQWLSALVQHSIKQPIPHLDPHLATWAESHHQRYLKQADLRHYWQWDDMLTLQNSLMRPFPVGLDLRRESDVMLAYQVAIAPSEVVFQRIQDEMTALNYLSTHPHPSQPLVQGLTPLTKESAFHVPTQQTQTWVLAHAGDNSRAVTAHHQIAVTLREQLGFAPNDEKHVTIAPIQRTDCVIIVHQTELMPLTDLSHYTTLKRHFEMSGSACHYALQPDRTAEQLKAHLPDLHPRVVGTLYDLEKQEWFCLAYHLGSIQFDLQARCYVFALENYRWKLSEDGQLLNALLGFMTGKEVSPVAQFPKRAEIMDALMQRWQSDIEDQVLENTASPRGDDQLKLWWENSLHPTLPTARKQRAQTLIATCLLLEQITRALEKRFLTSLSVAPIERDLARVWVYLLKTRQKEHRLAIQDLIF